MIKTAFPFMLFTRIYVFIYDQVKGGGTAGYQVHIRILNLISSFIGRNVT